MLHSSSLSTNRPSPLRKKMQINVRSTSSHPDRNRSTITTERQQRALTRKDRQRVRGGSRYLIRGASHRSSSSHGQPNQQPGLLCVDPDDPHRQCSTFARNNDFPWEDIARLLPMGLPMTSNAPGKIGKLAREYCVWRAS
jgi:hypothetical protein